MYASAGALNAQNVIHALKTTGPHHRLLDVGCWDGQETLVWASAGGVREVHGIELISTAAKLASQKGILVSEITADDHKWPFKKDYFDCIVSNQVIEHLTNVDLYFSECSRTLKPRGHLITSTNNLASWHNIVSLLIGWTPFDLTNSSAKRMGLGTPLAVHQGEANPRGNSWTHKCVYTSAWLKDWQSLYGLEQIKTLGAGLYPFPASLGRMFPTHSAFITVISQKK